MYKEFRPMVELQPRSHDHTERPRTINSLAIRAYMKEYDSNPARSDDFDPELLETTIQQIKILFFAGHDTTSSALCFAYSRCYKSPNNLGRLRAEHDAVFSPNPSTAASRTAATPAFLNQLPDTTAFIKERLRLDASVLGPTGPPRLLPHAPGSKKGLSNRRVNSHFEHSSPATFARSLA